MAVSTQLSVRKQWLPYGFACQYDLTAELSQREIQKLAELAIKELLPQEARTSDQVKDVRGRDPQRVIDPSLGPPPRREELLFISGRREVKLTDEEREAAEKDEPVRVSFELALHTEFKEFDGPKHIVHAIRRHQQGFDADSPQELTAAIDPGFEIETLRLGLEFFESRFLSIFGFSPIVTQTLLLEASAKTAKIRIVGEGMPARDTLPLQDRGTLEKLDRVTSQLFGLKLIEDYRKKLSA